MEPICGKCNGYTIVPRVWMGVLPPKICLCRLLTHSLMVKAPVL